MVYNVTFLFVSELCPPTKMEDDSIFKVVSGRAFDLTDNDNDNFPPSSQRGWKASESVGCQTDTGGEEMGTQTVVRGVDRYQQTEPLLYPLPPAASMTKDDYMRDVEARSKKEGVGKAITEKQKQTALGKLASAKVAVCAGQQVRKRAEMAKVQIQRRPGTTVTPPVTVATAVVEPVASTSTFVHPILTSTPSSTPKSDRRKLSLSFRRESEASKPSTPTIPSSLPPPTPTIPSSPPTSTSAPPPPATTTTTTTSATTSSLFKRPSLLQGKRKATKPLPPPPKRRAAILLDDFCPPRKLTLPRHTDYVKPQTKSPVVSQYFTAGYKGHRSEPSRSMIAEAAIQADIIANYNWGDDGEEWK